MSPDLPYYLPALTPLGGWTHTLPGLVTIDVVFGLAEKYQVEVDILLENRQGKVVAIDVKAASTVRADDFRGINHLAGRIGTDLVVGIVLYTGTATVPFGPRNRAVPLAALWEA